MKKIYLIISLLLLITIGGIAQNRAGLELRNTNSQSSVFIAEGSKISVVKDHQNYKGLLKIVSDQSICINSDTLLINQIQEITSKSSSRKVGGTALIIPGGVLTIGGLTLIGVGLASSDGYGFLGVVMGAPVAAVGILGIYLGIKMIKGKKFSPSKWEYRIVNPVS